MATGACPFCQIVDGRAPAAVVRSWHDAIAVIPLNPVTEGHILVIPRKHVPNALTNPGITADTMRRAAELAEGDCNLITSVGAAATQTVRHLHVHIVPRTVGDDLQLPWGGNLVCGWCEDHDRPDPRMHRAPNPAEHQRLP